MKKNRMFIWLALIGVLLFVLAACGGGGDTSSESSSSSASEPAAEEAVAVGDPTHGEELFVATCLACHGEGGVGIEGLGKDMTTSEFIKGLSDAELLAFIKVGRSTTDEANTTGVDMPLKGGNPALTDDDLNDIIAYMRTLEK
ncbi:MAG: c-type cytochrome [Aquificales bacterium]|nr:c-type cytochrome [Aquificales bacterium]